MERVDIAIIGTGPGGLEAAITAINRNKKILLIGSKDFSDKVSKAHMIKNYLGLPDAAGDVLAKSFKNHIESMGVEITEDKINAVYAMGKYFSLQGANETYEATTVILATGVVMAKPYPGENEFLGRGVSYCATCDAPLYKGKTVAVIAATKKEEAEADFLTEVCENVLYFPIYKETPSVCDKVTVINEKPLEIKGDMKAHTLVTNAGEYEVDCIFVLRDAISPGQLVPGLATEGAHVKTDRQMTTNIPGCFVCGDLAGKPYQYIKAAGEGNVAALSAVDYIAELKKAEQQA